MPEKKWRRDGQRFSSADDEPIKFDRYRFAGNSNSSSMDETRKNRVIVGTTGTLHALSLSLSRQPNENEWRGEVFEESLPSKLSHLSEFLGKSIQSPRGENAAKRRRERRSPSSEASKRAEARAAFRFPHHFAPFTEGRAPRKGWLTALIVPRRNGLLGFPSGFLHPLSPLFFQLTNPRQFK